MRRRSPTNAGAPKCIAAYTAIPSPGRLIDRSKSLLRCTLSRARVRISSVNYINQVEALVFSNRKQNHICQDAGPMQTEIEMHGHSQSAAAGKLPPEAPPPVEGFGLHVQSLKNLVGAGLDMKNSSDYEALVSPLLQRCGGSIEAIASKIKANMSGGLSDADNASSRKSAFGENRLPEKPMVTSKPVVIYQLKHQRLVVLCTLLLHFAFSHFPVFF